MVKEASGKSGKFNYIVFGPRKGFENRPIIRNASEILPRFTRP